MTRLLLVQDSRKDERLSKQDTPPHIHSFDKEPLQIVSTQLDQ